MFHNHNKYFWDQHGALKQASIMLYLLMSRPTYQRFWGGQNRRPKLALVQGHLFYFFYLAMLTTMSFLDLKTKILV